MRTIVLSLLLCAVQTMCGCTHKAGNDTIPECGNCKSECGDCCKAKRKLIYCSYASVGHAALGTDYCELIADPGITPKIVVVLDENCHFADPVKKEYKVDSTVVAEVQKGLEELKAWEINGYNKTEMMDGGRSHRVHIEYESDEKVHASWFTHDVKPEVLAVYNYLERFFSPWVKKTRETRRGNEEVEEVDEPIE